MSDNNIDSNFASFVGGTGLPNTTTENGLNSASVSSDPTPDSNTVSTPEPTTPAVETVNRPVYSYDNNNLQAMVDKGHQPWVHFDLNSPGSDPQPISISCAHCGVACGILGQEGSRYIYADTPLLTQQCLGVNVAQG